MDRMTFVYIGFIPMFILYMFASYKKLRNNRALIILSITSFLLAIPGVLIKVPEAAMLTGAFIYLISYSLLRYIYIKKYSFEPTYNKSSWYDANEGRRQNWLDVIVYVMPILLSMIVPVAIIIAKAKGLL